MVGFIPVDPRIDYNEGFYLTVAQANPSDPIELLKNQASSDMDCENVKNREMSRILKKS